MILQKLYNLSDPRLAEEIADRTSFRLFLELTTGDAVPDETTICRYRKTFAEAGYDKLLLKEFNEQLKKRNFIPNKGTIVDAALIEAQARTGEKDPDATHTAKRGKPTFGCKGHISMDKDTGIVTKTEFTPANVHDSTMFEQVVESEAKAVYADKGYANRDRRKNLAEQNIEDCNFFTAFLTLNLFNYIFFRSSNT